MVEAMPVGTEEAALSPLGLCQPSPGSDPIPGEWQRERGPR